MPPAGRACSAQLSGDGLHGGGDLPGPHQAHHQLDVGGEPAVRAHALDVLADRAQGVTAQFKGPDDSLIQENVFGPALDGLDRGDSDADAAWEEALSLLGELVE